jgi:hypothetical protein
VAPSLVICASPRSFTMSLSIPLGPNVVASVSAIARHAEMFDNNCPFPCDVSVPSLRRTTVGCCGNKVRVISSTKENTLTMGKGLCIFFFSRTQGVQLQKPNPRIQARDETSLCHQMKIR